MTEEKQTSELSEKIPPNYVLKNYALLLEG